MFRFISIKKELPRFYQILFIFRQKEVCNLYFLWGKIQFKIFLILYLFNLQNDQISKSFIEKEIEIEPLNIYFKNVNGDSKIRKQNEKEYYSLSKSASGYQSLIPIVLVIKYYNERKKAKTFITEEPEINLFPNAQKVSGIFAESVNLFNHQFYFLHILLMY